MQRLKGLAEWNRTNGEAVYGAGKSQWTPPFGTCYTQKGNDLYLHFFQKPLGDVILPQLKGKIESITLLRTGTPVDLIDFWGFELLRADEQRIRPKDVKSGNVLKIVLKQQGN